MFEIPNMNISLTQKQLQEKIVEAREEIKKGRPMQELLEKYKEKYSMQEAFLILLQAQLQAAINPQFHNFTGNVRKK